MSFRNRCVIGSSNGPVHLSVPLENGRDSRRLTKDARINYSGRWLAEHIRTFDSCYARSAFYEYYRDEVITLLEKRDVFLLDKNMAILEWLKKVLRIPGSVALTGTYRTTPPAGVTDMRDRVLPKNYHQFEMPFTYTQVFSDRLAFMPNLCILDLLFCTGPGATDLLRKSKG